MEDLKERLEAAKAIRRAKTREWNAIDALYRATSVKTERAALRTQRRAVGWEEADKVVKKLEAQIKAAPVETTPDPELAEHL
jgi:hypothetical protein